MSTSQPDLKSLLLAMISESKEKQTKQPPAKAKEPREPKLRPPHIMKALAPFRERDALPPASWNRSDAIVLLIDRVECTCCGSQYPRPAGVLRRQLIKNTVTFLPVEMAVRPDSLYSRLPHDIIYRDYTVTACLHCFRPSSPGQLALF